MALPRVLLQLQEWKFRSQALLAPRVSQQAGRDGRGCRIRGDSRREQAWVRWRRYGRMQIPSTLHLSCVSLPRTCQIRKEPDLLRERYFFPARSRIELCDYSFATYKGGHLWIPGMRYRDVESAELCKGERHLLPWAVRGPGRTAARMNPLPTEDPLPSAVVHPPRKCQCFVHRFQHVCAFPNPEVLLLRLVPIHLFPKRLLRRSHTR